MLTLDDLALRIEELRQLAPRLAKGAPTLAVLMELAERDDGLETGDTDAAVSVHLQRLHDEQFVDLTEDRWTATDSGVEMALRIRGLVESQRALPRYRAAVKAALPLVAGATGGTAATLVIAPPTDPSYYAAVAQIIPVLLLALVVESRVLGVRGRQALPVLRHADPEILRSTRQIRWMVLALDGYRVAIALVLLIAELLALDGAAGSPADQAPGVIAFAVGFSIAAIAAMTIRFDASET